MNLYGRELIDYYKNPRNRGELEPADIKTEEYNPSCGDKVQFFIRLADNKIQEITFMGIGCVISQATASMLTELAKGKSLQELLHLTAQDILTMIQLNLGPTRLRCALLSLYALQKGIKIYLNSEEHA